jgi:hypothetical protein
VITEKLGAIFLPGSKEKAPPWLAVKEGDTEPTPKSTTIPSANKKSVSMFLRSSPAALHSCVDATQSISAVWITLIIKPSSVIRTP